MTEQTRRDFLKRSGSAVLGASTIGLLGPSLSFGDNSKWKAAQPPTLVVIYLRGGADSLSAVVPFRDPLYRQIRPTIGIAAQDTKDAKGALPLSKQFGFHPAMAPLYEHYKNGLCVPIINVGSPHKTRSHFDAQDFMEYAAPGVRSITEGWLNRYLTTTKKDSDSELRALAMQPLLPRSLRGEYAVLAVPGTGGSDEALDSFDSLYMCKEDREMTRRAAKEEMKRSRTDEEVAGFIRRSGRNTIEMLRKVRAITSRPRNVKAKYPSTRFGEQMKGIAQTILADVGLEVASVDYRGWDHHARQGGAEGKMSKMLGDLSGSMAAFADDLGSRMDRTLVLCMSEFGRTVRENGNNGSDHGHGGFMLALGGMVNGKRLYGKWTGLEKEQLWQGRDMPVHTDFRAVFYETLYRVFGMKKELAGMFPDWRPGIDAESKPLNFLKSV